MTRENNTPKVEMPGLKAYLADKYESPQFDRHSPTPPKYIHKLRGFGGHRMFSLYCTGFKGNDRYPNKYYQYESTAFSEADAFIGFDKWKGKVFVDAGCGHSGDVFIASKKGAKKCYGIDLYEPDIMYPKEAYEMFKDKGVSFRKGDICDMHGIPANSVDVISCSAVIDLLTEPDRMLFYREVKRVLKPGGVFSLYIQQLKNGYYTDPVLERDRISQPAWGISLNRTHKYTGNALVFVKTSDQSDGEGRS